MDQLDQLLDKPMVRCVQDYGYANLTYGKVYFMERRTFGEHCRGEVRIINDAGHSYVYPERLFKNVE